MVASDRFELSTSCTSSRRSTVELGGYVIRFLNPGQTSWTRIIPMDIENMTSKITIAVEYAAVPVKEANPKCGSKETDMHNTSREVAIENRYSLIVSK